MHLPFLKNRPAQVRFDYHPIADENNTSHTPWASALTKRPPSRGLWYCLLILWNLLLAGLAVYGINNYLHGMSPKPVTCYCGSSIAEAKTLGCKYDTLSASWLPVHCRDDDLTAEFDRAGPGPNGEWTYWADVNATHPITAEEIARLAELPPSRAVFYTSYGWHVAHCAFSWRKEFRMRAKGSMMEERYDRETHIEHCYAWFMKDTPLNQTGTAAVAMLGGDRFLPKDEEAHESHATHAHTR